MIFGLGTDIIEVERIRSSIEEHGDRFLERLFTMREKEYCLKHRHAYRNFAGRFAVKEAIVKALGTGIGKSISWKEIEVLNNEQGKPFVSIKGEKREDLLVSISHCRLYATATALWIQK